MSSAPTADEIWKDARWLAQAVDPRVAARPQLFVAPPCALRIAGGDEQLEGRVRADNCADVTAGQDRAAPVHRLAVLEQGREEGTLRFSGSGSEAAQMIVGGLEGAMLVTRPYGDPALFQIAADHLLASFAAGTPASVR